MCLKLIKKNYTCINYRLRIFYFFIDIKIKLYYHLIVSKIKLTKRKVVQRMRLYKKLVVGSMALALGLGNLHAMEGRSSSGAPKTLYDFTKRYDSNKLIIHRESCIDPIAKSFKEQIQRLLQTGFKLRNYSDWFALSLFKDMLRANGLFNGELNKFLSEWTFSTDVPSNEIIFFACTPSRNNFNYVQQLFPIPFYEGTDKIDVTKFKNMLSDLLKNIEILTIKLPGYWINLKTLHSNWGLFTAISNNGTEVPETVSNLVNFLENKKIKVLHVNFLDKFPKHTDVKIYYPNGYTYGFYTSEKEDEYSSDKKLSFEKFLDKYLKSSEKLSKDEIKKICNDATEVLKKESSLLKIEGPTIVVGDIHADLGALEYSVRKFLEANGEKNILFLGDYVDRGMGAPGGPNSIKNAAILLKLKTMFPDKVFLLRGNHEDKNINYFDFRHTHTLYTECVNGYGEESGTEIFNSFNDTFNYLSLGAIVNKSTFCVHGGISPDLTNVNQIEKIEKPCSVFGLVSNLLWSDPIQRSYDLLYEKNSKRGAGYLFSKKAALYFLKNNNLKRILRAHQLANGYEDVFKDGSVITLFSVPKYLRMCNNKGAIAEINGEDIKYEAIDYNKNDIVKPTIQ